MKKKISLMLFFAVIIVIGVFQYEKRNIPFEKLSGGAKPSQIMVTQPFKNDNSLVFSKTFDENEAYQINELFSKYKYEETKHSMYSSFRDSTENLMIMTIDFESVKDGKTEYTEYTEYVNLSSEHKQLIFSMDGKRTIVFPADGETEDIFNSIMEILNQEY